MSWYQIYEESISNFAFMKEYHTFCEVYYTIIFLKNIFIFTFYTLLINSELYFAEHLSTPAFLMKYMDQYKSLLSKYNIDSDPLEVFYYYYYYISAIAIYEIIKQFKIRIQDNSIRK